jgi:hypothetical protein
MTNFTQFDATNGDMFFISGSNKLQAVVSGSKTTGYVPQIQADGTVQWALISGSGSPGSGSGTTLTRDVISYTTPSIGSASFDTGTLPLGTSFMVLQVSASSDSRIRLYTTAAQRDADLNRPIGQIPVGKHGLICDVVPTGSDSLVIPFAPLAMGANLEASLTGAIAHSIQNRQSATQTVSVAITRIIYPI